MIEEPFLIKEPTKVPDILGIVESAWKSSHGFQCMCIFMEGHRNGYVGVPPEHVVHGLDYNHNLLIEVDVHGGLTYAGRLWEHSDWWYVGFDCAHAYDGKDIETYEEYIRRGLVEDRDFAYDQMNILTLYPKDITIRTTHYVEEEVKSWPDN
jgi:hypothetical protein